MTSQDDFLCLQPVVLAQLEAALSKLTPRPHLFTPDDLDGVLENQQFTPAVHLVYGGYDKVVSNHDGKSAIVGQEWQCIVVTRNQKQLRTGTAARGEAGVLARKVCAALMGFRPTPGSTPLKLVPTIKAGYSGGFQYLPLAFAAEVTFHPTKENL